MLIKVNTYSVEYNDDNEYFSSLKKLNSMMIDLDPSSKISSIKLIDKSWEHFQSFILDDNLLNSAKDFITYDNDESIIWEYSDNDFSIDEYFKIFKVVDGTINLANSSERGCTGVADFFTLLLDLNQHVNEYASSYPVAYDFVKYIIPVMIFGKKWRNFVASLAYRGSTLNKLSSYFEMSEELEMEKLKKLFDTEDEQLLKALLENFKFIETGPGVYNKDKVV